MMSLRMRLVLIILVPLLMIAGVVGFLALRDAEARAAERFDRSLLSAALAISRDVAVSGGDALSPETTAILRDTSNGRVFYHVYAPDGVFVTGYATPPVPPRGAEGAQVYFDSAYQGEAVRSLRFVDTMLIDGLSGDFTFTVWQDHALRDALVADLSWRTFQIIASLVLGVALVVWFGVRSGLRPLLDLEAAIAKRSPDDLTPIRRAVPVEAAGIANRLNQLFGRVDETLAAKNTFISNAAHQLRNPIAGVVAMSEAVGSAPSFEAMQGRSVELVAAAKHAGDLADKLLALDRATSMPKPANLADVDLVLLILGLVAGAAKRTEVEIATDVPDHAVYRCDPTLMGEAIGNLMDNALVHGGESLRRIEIALTTDGGAIEITVTDDGVGISVEHIARVKERFVQGGQSPGSGLGLAISEAILRQIDGTLEIEPNMPSGTRMVVRLPAQGGAYTKLQRA